MILAAPTAVNKIPDECTKNLKHLFSLISDLSTVFCFCAVAILTYNTLSLFFESSQNYSQQQFRNVGYVTTFRPGRSILVAVEPLEIEWLGR